MRVNLYTSTEEVIDRASNGKLVNDALLGSTIQQVNLRPGESTTFDLKFDNITSVGAPGACNLILEVDPKNRIAEGNEGNNQVWEQISATGSDVVLQWNATALNALQAEGKAGRGVPPTTGSRLLAITAAL